MSITKVISIFILWQMVCPVWAQDALPDRVAGTPNYLEEIVKNYQEENAFPFDLNAISISVKIPVRVHIIYNHNGKTGVSLSDIQSSLSTANTYFSNIGIRFYIDSVHYINDYDYGYITRDHNLTELLTLYAEPDKINLFMADSVLLGTERSYGYTFFPIAADSNYIFLDKKYTGGKYLTTLMGHYMGLLSTHENGKGYELASEKNCSSSGDFICDTYADPDLYNQVDTTCTYTGSSRDEGGKYYAPTVANIMSNSSDDCKCIFTPLQYRRMYYYYLKYRQKQK